MPPSKPEGHHGWDDYARFYDWENARTLGRRDVPFWRSVAARSAGRVLELGCGTGRITLPLGRAGARIVGIDRSAPMLDRARRRVKRARLSHVQLVRGDIRSLPFCSHGPAKAGAHTKPATHAIEPTTVGPHSRFATVIAPYGILQSLLREADLSATLNAVHEVLAPGGTFGLELVADLPSWEEYRRRVSLRGWRRSSGGAHVTLVETVRQDRARRLTIFDQEFTERNGRRTQVHKFSLTFRTLTVPQMVRRLEKAGFAITALLGDYRGGPWDTRAEVWVILATRPETRTSLSG
jgi:SAM-dependent methyltransferase